MLSFNQLRDYLNDAFVSTIFNILLDKALGSISNRLSMLKEDPQKDLITALENSLIAWGDTYAVTVDLNHLKKFILDYSAKMADTHFNVSEVLIDILVDVYGGPLNNEMKNQWAACFIEEASKSQALTNRLSLSTILGHRAGIRDARDYFINMWKKPLFLENTDSKQLSLEYIYILPNYNHINHSYKIRNEVSNDILLRIEQYYEGSEDTSAIVILGQPGIGKSSLIANFVYRHKNEQDFIVLPFKCLEEGPDLIEAVRKYLECDLGYLQNKMLILDAFDEASIISNPQFDSTQILMSCIQKLNEIYSKYKGIKLLITSRYNYISASKLYLNSKIDVCELIEFDEFKIRSLLDNLGVPEEKSQVILNLVKEERYNLLRFPLVLYMVIRSQIEIEHINGKNQLYDKLFGENGALLQSLYSAHKHVVTYYEARQLFEITKKIAWTMYIHRKEALSTKFCINICNEYSEKYFLSSQESHILRSSFGISCYYKNSIKDGSVEFIHRSIQEFYISQYVIDLINDFAQNIKNCENIEKFINQFSVTLLSEFVFEYIKPLNNNSDIYPWINTFLLEAMNTTLRAHDKITLFINIWNLSSAMECQTEFEYKNFMTTSSIFSDQRINSKLIMRGKKFKDCNLSLAKFGGALSVQKAMQDLIFTHCEMDCIVFDKVSVIGTEYISLSVRCGKFLSTNVYKTNFQDVTFQCTLLAKTVFSNCHLLNVSFKDCSFDNFHISNCIIDKNTLRHFSNNRGRLVFSNCIVKIMGSQFDLDEAMVDKYICNNEYLRVAIEKIKTDL